MRGIEEKAGLQGIGKELQQVEVQSGNAMGKEGKATR